MFGADGWEKDLISTCVFVALAPESFILALGG